jgi:hypothetical protein
MGFVIGGGPDQQAQSTAEGAPPERVARAVIGC